MKIIYIFRPKGRGYSIERVFKPIIDFLSSKIKVTTNVTYSVDNKSTFKTLFANIIKFSILSSNRNKIFHITGEVSYCAPFMNKNNTVLTIHDTYTLHNSKAPWYARLFSYWFQFYFPLRHLKYITLISYFTKDDIIRYFPWAESKLVVINNPIDSNFKYVLKPFNANCPIILHVGTKANKNLLRVCEALKGVKCHLRIVGQITPEQREFLIKCNIDYSNVFNISDEEMIFEYENCDILSFPSLFEGFGMPIVEAQAVGRPIVTSNIEPMKSISGGSAVFVDPEDIVSIKHGFEVLINNELERNKCVYSGLENSKKYSQEEIARKYMDLYDYVESNLNKNSYKCTLLNL